MSRMVFCKKLQKELPALAFQTWPGELGKRVFENISAKHGTNGLITKPC